MQNNMIFHKEQEQLVNGLVCQTIQEKSIDLIMDYLNAFPYMIWEFSICGLLNELEFGDIFYHESDNSLTIFYRDKQTQLTNLFAPPFTEPSRINSALLNTFQRLRHDNPRPLILRISPDEIPLFDPSYFTVINKHIPLFTIYPETIYDLSKPLFRRLRRGISQCNRKFGAPLLRPYSRSNYELVADLRRRWEQDARKRGLIPDSDAVFLYLLQHQELYGIDSFEVYLDNTLAGFISFAPHHGNTGINLYRIANNNFTGLSGYAYIEALKRIAVKYQIILDGSGSAKSLFEFKRQFTDIIYNEYAVRQVE